MKILHTADWHLGRTLAGRDLLPDQEFALMQLINIARDERVDAIVIAGDVYDRAQPPDKAVKLFGEVLTQLQAIGRVLCIAGNHDSGGRISFASELLAKSGVHMAGNELGAPIHVDVTSKMCTTDSVRFHLMPYATPEEVRSVIGEEAIRTHSDAIKARVAMCNLAKDGPNVLVGHLFAQGCHPSDSERDIAVGGIPQVDMSLFSQFAYTALGHLHQPHDVPKAEGTTGHARYSGSICRYSFSEENHDKGVTIVTIDREGCVSTQHLQLKPKMGMRTIRGAFGAIISAANLEDPHSREFVLVRIELTDSTLINDAHSRLRALYPHMLESAYVCTAASVGSDRISEEQLRDGKPIENFKLFFTESGAHLSDVQKTSVMNAATDCMQIADQGDQT